MDAAWWARLDQLEEEEIREARDLFFTRAREARQAGDQQLEHTWERAALACMIAVAARQNDGWAP